MWRKRKGAREDLRSWKKDRRKSLGKGAFATFKRGTWGEKKSKFVPRRELLGGGEKRTLTRKKRKSAFLFSIYFKTPEQNGARFLHPSRRKGLDLEDKKKEALREREEGARFVTRETKGKRRSVAVDRRKKPRGNLGTRKGETDRLSGGRKRPSTPKGTYCRRMETIPAKETASWKNTARGKKGKRKSTDFS